MADERVPLHFRVFAVTIRAVLALLLWAMASVGIGCAQAPPPDSAETVIVVHGLGRTPVSMAILTSRLENAGFRVVSFRYPSTSEPIDSLVAHLAREVDRCCASLADQAHFVTHSMGGVLVWSYLSQQPEPHQGRVVMLAPPSRGSELIDALSGSPFLEPLLGPAGAGLGTDSLSIPNQLAPVNFSLGIITGDRSINPINSRIIPGPDDGKVSVERARADGAEDFLVLPATHTFIMNRGDVAEEVVHFLRNGSFRKRSP
jgi:triacylglycerol lipase